MTPKKLMLLGLVMFAASFLLSIVLSLVASTTDIPQWLPELISGATLGTSVLVIVAGGLAWIIQVGVRGARD